MGSRLAVASLVAVLSTGWPTATVASPDRRSAGWQHVTRGERWELRLQGRRRYVGRPGVRLLGEAVESPYQGDLAFVEAEGERRARRCTLVVLLAEVDHPPLRWRLPRCDDHLRPHWAGAHRLTLGPSPLAPRLSVRFSVDRS